ncbi:hypothetical protein KAU88_07290 [Candidatus Bathyarchaeota archaeon]|nr:hypothetical protein [Candidatus Bathyarchaeota archaeon]
MKRQGTREECIVWQDLGVSKELCVDVHHCEKYEQCKQAEQERITKIIAEEEGKSSCSP